MEFMFTAPVLKALFVWDLLRKRNTKNLEIK